MKRSALLVALAGTALSCGMAASAYATDAAQAAPAAAPANAVAKLQIDSGSAMLSTDQQAFQTASPQQEVAAGERLMLTTGSAVTLVYDSGCKVSYNLAGVYTVPSTCNKPVAPIASSSGAASSGAASSGAASAGVSGKTIAWIAGGAVVVGLAASGGGGGGNSTPPVSH